MNARQKKYFNLRGPRPAEPETLLARKTPRNNRNKSERKCNEDRTKRKESGKKVERNRKESGKKAAIFKDLAEWGMGERKNSKSKMQDSEWRTVLAVHFAFCTLNFELRSCFLRASDFEFRIWARFHRRWASADAVQSKIQNRTAPYGAFSMDSRALSSSSASPLMSRISR